VVATDAYGQTDTSPTASVTVNHYSPVVTDISPSGPQSAKPSQITADVNDTDFAVDGDTLSVEILLDGTTLSTQTLNDNTTVSASIPQSGQTGGEHTITIEADDAYGQTEITSATYSVPTNFTIRAERDHDKLIPADGRVTFFTEDQVYTRQAPDGYFDLTGLPVNEEFIVRVEPTDGNYTTRTIYIESIYEQQAAYVLNTSAVSTVESRFVLNDPTGQYTSESLIKIKRPINISGNTRYQIIVSDEFGSEGVTAVLQENIRYEIAVASDTASQTIGPYRADVSETVEVTPGSPAVENLTVTQIGGAVSNPLVGATLDNDTLEYQYADPTGETDTLTVYIHERGEPNTLLQPNQTYMSLGNASGMASLTKNETTREWVITYVVERNGETSVWSTVLSNRKSLGPPVGENWQVMIGIGLLVLFAGTFSVLNAGIGAVLVSLIGGLLWWLGFLGPATSAIGITIALMVSVVGYMVGRR
jgi:hypothetical protein